MTNINLAMDSLVNVSGLVRVRVSIFCEGNGEKVARIKIVGQEDYCEFQVESNMPVEKWIIVCSHLLEDGSNKLVMELSTSGDVHAVSELEFSVSNGSLLASKVRQSLVQKGVPLFLGEEVGSENFDYLDKTLVPWFDRDDALDRIDTMGLSDEVKSNLKNFTQDGYITLSGLLEPELVTQVLGELDTVIEEGYQGYSYGDSQRLHDLHAHYPGVNQIWRHPKIMDYIRLIFSSEPRPCQTLTYIFGSQQGAHQDTVHLTPFPAGYMCGVWVALEDVRKGSGELVVYRGSHKLPRIYLDTVGCGKVRGDESEFVSKVVTAWDNALSTNSFEEEIYMPSAGDVLIWHENLMHAGSKRMEAGLSRKSIVSHVFADGCIAYYDSSGSVANMGVC